MIKFDFSTIPIKLSGKVVNYICPKCKVKFEAPIEMVHEFEEDDIYEEDVDLSDLDSIF